MSLLKVLITIIVLSSASLTASAPFWTWDGFYVGLNGGLVRCYDKLSFSPEGLWRNEPPELRNLIATNGRTRLTNWNFIVGGQVGYNWHMFRCLLVGIEADGNYVHLTDHRRSIPVPFGLLSYQFADRIRHNWLVTIRPRIGVVYNRVLTYLTGGLAAGDVRASSRIVEFVDGYASLAETSKTLNGWTFGIGSEFAFKPFVTVKFEYLYVNLGHFRTTSTPNAPFAGFFEERRYHIREDVIRFGINYRL